MSLKAKLEAVIYAAEEPVTLAQLAALFAAEAFEYKAEQETAAAEAAAEAAGDLLSEEFDGASVRPVDVVARTAPAPEESAAGESEAEQPEQEPRETSPAEPAEDAVQAPADSAPADQPAEEEPAGEDRPAAEAGQQGELPLADAEGELKRQARLRDREARAILKQLLDEIVAAYVTDGHGVEIREIAGGYRMATKPECHDAVRLFVKSLKPPLKLSLAALETLAVVAYKQPITAPEVSEIRGVESAGVLGSLLARKLVATAGRKQVIGRPILYKTTKEFLLRFGLKDLTELPSMEEFEKMAAIELEEPGAEESADEQLPIEAIEALEPGAEDGTPQPTPETEADDDSTVDSSGAVPSASGSAPQSEATEPAPPAEPQPAEAPAATAAAEPAPEIPVEEATADLQPAPEAADIQAAPAKEAE
jgi:segregation and condensation protein B